MRRTEGVINVGWILLVCILIFPISLVHGTGESISVTKVTIDGTDYAPVNITAADNIREGDWVTITVSATHSNPLTYHFTPSTDFVSEPVGADLTDNEYRFFVSYDVIQGAITSDTFWVKYRVQTAAGDEFWPGDNASSTRQITFTVVNGNPKPWIEQVEKKEVGKDSLEFWVNEQDLLSLEVYALDQPMDEPSFEYQILEPTYYSIFNDSGNHLDFTDNSTYSSDALPNFVKAQNPKTGQDTIYLRWRPPSTAVPPPPAQDKEEVYRFDLQVRDGGWLKTKTSTSDESVSARVTITVHVVDQNAPPMLAWTALDPIPEDQDSVAVQVTGSDVDEQLLDYTVHWDQISPYIDLSKLAAEYRPYITPDDNVAAGQAVSLRWKPPYSAVKHGLRQQTYQIPVTVTDPVGLTDTKTVEFKVDDVNRVPDIGIHSGTIPDVAEAGPPPLYRIREGQVLNLKLSAPDADSEDTPWVEIEYLDLGNPALVPGDVGLPATGDMLPMDQTLHVLAWTPGYDVVPENPATNPDAKRWFKAKFTAKDWNRSTRDVYEQDLSKYKSVEVIIEVLNSNEPPWFTWLREGSPNTSNKDVTNWDPNPPNTDDPTYTVQETQPLKIKLEAEDKEQAYADLDMYVGPPESRDDANDLIEFVNGAWYFIWTPGYDTVAPGGNENLTKSFTYDLYVEDTAGTPHPLSDMQRIHITVQNKNRDPNALAGGDDSADENTTVTVDMSTTDPDGDDLIYSWEYIENGNVVPWPAGVNPPHMQGGRFVWDVPYNAAPYGTSPKYDFRIKASDGNGGSRTKDIAITVNDVNRTQPTVDSPPSPGSGGGAGSGGPGGPKGQPGVEVSNDVWIYHIIERDTLQIQLTDPDGDPLQAGTGIIATDASGTPLLDSNTDSVYNNAWGWDDYDNAPAKDDFKAVPPSAGNTWTFKWKPSYDTVQATATYREFHVRFAFQDDPNGTGTPGTQDAIIRVYHRNRPPEIKSITLEQWDGNGYVTVGAGEKIPEDTQARLTVVAFDPDGDVIKRDSSATQPNPSNLWGNNPPTDEYEKSGKDYVGEFVWTVPYSAVAHPAADKDYGVTLGVYDVISDGDDTYGPSVTVTVQKTVPILDVNRKPEFTTFTRTQPGANLAKNITNTDAEPDTPNPVTFVDDESVFEDQEMRISLLADDPDSDSLAYSISDRGNLPAEAQLQGSVFVWKPGFDAAETNGGIYTFTVHVTESPASLPEPARRKVDEHQIRIQVKQTNLPPYFTLIVDDATSQTIKDLENSPEDNPKVLRVENQKFNLSIQGADPDGDPVTITLSSGNPGGTFVFTAGATAQIGWPTDYNTVQAGTKDFLLTLQISDGSSNVTQKLTLQVQDVNREPGFTQVDGEDVAAATITLTRKATEGVKHTFTIAGDDKDDYDDAALTYLINASPVGTVLVNGNQIQWTPPYTTVRHDDPDGKAEVSFELKVTDGKPADETHPDGYPNTVTVKLVVVNKNLPPDYTEVAGEALPLDPEKIFLAKEGTEFSLQLKATDGDTEDITSLSHVLALPADLKGDRALTPATGDTVLFTWTPDFSTVITKEFETLTLRFEVTDPDSPALDDSITTSLELTVRVFNANQPPVFVAATAETSVDSLEGKTKHTLSITAQEDVAFRVRFDARDEDDRIWKKDRSTEVKVAATDTFKSIMYVYKGDVLFITANGEWNFGSGPVNADGYLPGTTAGTTGIVSGALMGRIGRSRIFFVGRNKTLTATTEGYLELGPSSSVAGATGEQIVWTQRSSGNYVKLSLVAPPKDAKVGINPDTGEFTWTPTVDDVQHANVQAPYQFRIAAEDMFGAVSELLLTINLDDTNQAPAAPKQKYITVKEGEPVRMELKLSDPDGDALAITPLGSLTINGWPVQTTWDGSTLAINMDTDYSTVPRTQSRKTFPIEFTLDDQFSPNLDLDLQTSYTFTIIVEDQNPPPEWTITGSTSVAEGVEFKIVVQVTDPETEPTQLRCYFLSDILGSTGAKFELTDPLPDTPGNLVAEGTFTWMPPFGTIRPPMTAATFEIMFYSEDSRKEKKRERVHLTVTDANQPPEFTSIGTVDPGGTLLFELTEQEEWSISFAATDPEHDSIEFLVEPLNDAKLFAGKVDGATLSWTPDYDVVPHEAQFEANGSWQRDFNVKFTATDSVGGEAVRQGTIRVHDLNRPPEWSVSLQDLSVYELSPISIQLAADDLDGDTITFGYAPQGSPTPEQDVNAPVPASFQTDTFTWTPSQQVVILPTESVKHRVKFTASDGVADPIEQQPVIEVVNYNRDPVLGNISPLSQTIREGETATITVSQSSDPEGDPLTLQALGSPFNLGASFDATTGKFTWQTSYDLLSPPTTGETYRVQFVLTDPYGGRASAEATITLLEYDPFATNNAPSITAINVLQPAGGTLPLTVSEEETVEIEVKASDPDGDSLLFKVVQLPPGASFTAKQGKTNVYRFLWTPSYSVNMPPTTSTGYDLRFTVDDGKRGTDTETTRLIVENANAKPQIRKVGNKQVVEGEDLTFTVVEGETLTLPIEVFDPDMERVLVAVSGDLNVQPVNNVWSWSPPYNTVNDGTTKNVSITFTATDGGGATDSVNVVITVSDRTPRFISIGGVTVIPGQDVSFTATEEQEKSFAIVVDASGNYSFDGLVLPGGITWNGNTFSWTPPAATVSRSEGNKLIRATIAVTDQNQRTDKALLAIRVQHVNLPPVIEAISAQSVTEGDALYFRVNVTEPDGDPVQLSFTSDIPNTISQPTLSPSGDFGWRAPYDAVTQAEGSRKYTVTVSATDRDGTANQAVEITVTHKNVPPTLAPIGDRTVSEGSTLAFSLQASDPDAGDSLTYSGDFISGGQFSWAIDYETVTRQEGMRVFTFTATVKDSTGAEDSKTYRVRVYHTNRSPEFQKVNDVKVPVEIEVTEGETFSWPVTVVEFDGDPFTLSVRDSDIPEAAFTGIEVISGSGANSGDPPSPPSAAIKKATLTGTIPYGLVAAGKSTQSITIRADDSEGASDLEIVRLVIKHTNRPPEIIQIGGKKVTPNVPVEFAVKEGEDLRWSILATDPDGEAISYSLADEPSWVTLSGSTLLVKPGFALLAKGSDPQSFNFTLQVSDPTPATTKAEIHILLSDVNTPPEITEVQASPALAISEGSQLTLTVQATDIDGDSLTYAANLGRAGVLGATMVGNQITWTPPAQAASRGTDKSYTITIIVSDGRGGKAQQEVEIVVQHVNQAPVFTRIGHHQVVEGQTILLEVKERQTIRLGLEATDVDGDKLTYSLGANPPSSAKIENQELMWTVPLSVATADAPTDVSVQLVVSDDSNASDTETITLRVTNVNSPPVFKTVGGDEVKSGETLQFKVDEEKTLSLDIEVEDLDTAYTLTGGGEPFNLGATLTNGKFVWTPADTVVQSPVTIAEYNVVFTADDGLDKTQLVIKVRVRDKQLPPENNEPPTVNLTIPAKLHPTIGGKSASLKVAENGSVEIIVSATDPDGQDDQVRYIVYFLSDALGATGAQYDPDTRTFSWTPPEMLLRPPVSSAEYMLRILAIDQWGGKSWITVKIIVNDSRFSAAPFLIPHESQVWQSYPNPSNPETWIPYELASDADVQLTIYTAEGKPVRHFDVGYRKAGTYLTRELAIHWDGLSDRGEQVASGVYYYRFRAGVFVATRRLLVVQ